jgi:hypothetical protein
VCAPGDGWKYHPKYVEQFSDINKLCNVASCWIYIGIYLRCMDPKTSDLLIILANGRWDLTRRLKGQFEENELTSSFVSLYIRAIVWMTIKKGVAKLLLEISQLMYARNNVQMSTLTLNRIPRQRSKITTGTASSQDRYSITSPNNWIQWTHIQGEHKNTPWFQVVIKSILIEIFFYILYNKLIKYKY